MGRNRRRSCSQPSPLTLHPAYYLVIVLEANVIVAARFACRPLIPHESSPAAATYSRQHHSEERAPKQARDRQKQRDSHLRSAECAGFGCCFSELRWRYVARDLPPKSSYPSVYSRRRSCCMILGSLGMQKENGQKDKGRSVTYGMDSLAGRAPARGRPHHISRKELWTKRPNAKKPCASRSFFGVSR